MSLEHLPNAPLVEAVFEIRFNGNPAVLTRMDEFYASIRAEYPHVFVPNPNPGVPSELVPWQFKNEDQQRFIGISINSFAFHVLDYRDYHDFRGDALPLADRFCYLFGVDDLKRVGTRYVNSIIVLRTEEGTIPVRDYLNFGFDLPDIVPTDGLEDIHVQFASRMGKGRLVTIIHHERALGSRPESLLFDLDFSLDRDATSEHLAEYMDESHSYIEDVFGEFVAGSYMTFMKGDVA